MSRDLDDIIKQVMKQNKDIQNIDNYLTKDVSKEIIEIKKSIKQIENRIKSMDDTLMKLFDILNSITLFIEEAESINEEDIDDEEDWTPYDERNFSYQDDDEESNDDEWSNGQDES
jgi:hypothetical protein